MLGRKVSFGFKIGISDAAFAVHSLLALSCSPLSGSFVHPPYFDSTVKIASHRLVILLNWTLVLGDFPGPNPIDAEGLNPSKLDFGSRSIKLSLEQSVACLNPFQLRGALRIRRKRI